MPFVTVSFSLELFESSEIFYGDRIAPFMGGGGYWGYTLVPGKYGRSALALLE